MQGWISIHRKIMQNPLWLETRKFSKAEAWIDMLLHANHKRTKILLGTDSYELGPGQFITSQVKLADKWGWDRETVKKFLDYLTKEKSISYETSNRNTVITISNWDAYQKFDYIKPATESSAEPAEAPQQNPHQTSTDNNDNNVKNENNIKNQPKKPAQFSKELMEKAEKAKELGFNIYQLLGYFYKESKLTEKLPEPVLGDVLDEFLKRHEYINDPWPYFIRVIHAKSAEYFSQKNDEEHEALKKQPLAIGNIIALMASKKFTN